MTRLLAAMDDSAAARPVLDVARALAPQFGCEVSAVTVATDGPGTTAGAVAAAAGERLAVLHGDPVERLAEAVAADDVCGVVVGARGRPTGRRPAGHVACALATTCGKPVVVVPPEVAPVPTLERVLVAVEAPGEVASGLEGAPIVAPGTAVEVVAVHVNDETTLPGFSDQPQHEVEAFAEEFLARAFPDRSDHLRLELRVGVPVEEVLAVARDVGAQLVVVVWSCRMAPDHGLFVQALLAASHLPVLLVPAGG